jgi:hypothetical protein
MQKLKKKDWCINGIYCIHAFPLCLIILKVGKKMVQMDLNYGVMHVFLNLLCIKTNIQLLKLTEKHQTLQSHVEFRSNFFLYYSCYYVDNAVFTI